MSVICHFAFLFKTEKEIVSVCPPSSFSRFSAEKKSKVDHSRAFLRSFRVQSRPIPENARPCADLQNGPISPWYYLWISPLCSLSGFDEGWNAGKAPRVSIHTELRNRPSHVNDRSANRVTRHSVNMQKGGASRNGAGACLKGRQRRK